MLICKSCRDVFDREMLVKNHECPKLNCRGKLIEIDDALIPIIKNLWSNGIETKSCCSGHPTDWDSKGECFIEVDLKQSGVTMHEAVKDAKIRYIEDIYPTQDIYPIVEYNPNVNSYILHLYYTNYYSWITSMALLYRVSCLIKDAPVNNSISIDTYFFSEWSAKEEIDMCISTRVNSSYWKIYHDRAISNAKNMIDTSGDMYPEIFYHDWKPGLHEFNCATSFCNMEEFKNSLHAREFRSVDSK